MTRTLPWGKGQGIGLMVPDTWKIIVDHKAIGRPAIADVSAALAGALARPDAGPPLAELAAGARDAVIVIDDVGRPTPARLLAPAVLETLLSSGLAADRIKVVFALGTHRPMTEAEMRAKAGEDVFSRVRCENHNCRDPDNLLDIGTTSFHTPVLINRAVAEAGLRVLIGTIEPHPQAGFGGGGKLILPGCAGARSIGHNHLIMPSPDRYNMIGTLPDDNPMRQDIEQAAAMLPGKTFIVNTVLGTDLAPVALVAGEPVAAHEKGVAIARELYGVPLPRRLDAAIVSSFPMDVDLRQGVKGVANFPGAIKKGGAILCFLSCERGLDGIRAPRTVPPLGPVRLLLKLLGARGIYAITKRLPKKVPVEARFIINFGLQVLKDYHVLIFSPKLAAETGGRLGQFIFDDQARMFRRAEELLGTSAPEACIVAEGGVSFPVVDP
ncbi:MAG TPA: nickel-dependent lactate racemase [bacterium]|nr:nickel-dependent lactate racemase [bacterium]